VRDEEDWRVSRDTERLVALIGQVPHLHTILRAARDVGAPDWLVCAGAVRDAIWDLQHERTPKPPRDVDVVFFDSSDLSRARDAAVTAAVHARAPEYAWEAVNQAAVHTWYRPPFAPLRSTAEGVATFPEIATCVGVRLEANDAVTVVAPHGLSDLLDGVCRHNPSRASRDLYEERLASKRWRDRWPQLRFVAPTTRRSGPR
jgi:hypothetical protein